VRVGYLPPIEYKIIKREKRRIMQKNPNREQIYASYDWYHQMRETQPVYQDPDSGIWHTFRYDDVTRVLSDHATFSSDQNRFIPAEYRDSSPLSSSILRMDPPRHRQLRQLVSQAFTPRMVAHMESRIKEITSGLLDQVQALGEMDVIRDLAYPLPVTVILLERKVFHHLDQFHTNHPRHYPPHCLEIGGYLGSLSGAQSVTLGTGTPVTPSVN
jgi:cytochrome P450